MEEVQPNITQINLYNVCSYGKDKDTGRCMSDRTYEMLKAQEHNLNLNGDTLDALLSDKGATLDELGLLLDTRTIKVLGPNHVLQELQTNYKPVGPVNNQLFNNFHENNVLLHLSKYDPTFLGLDVNLMDFQNYGGSLTKITPDVGGVTFSGKVYQTFGCVMNTMMASGDLSRVGHWVALFGDFRGKKLNTVEYFNSSGRNAPKELFQWMEQFAEESARVRGIPCLALNVSNIQHQHSSTECGAYAVYYITARILGISYKKFREKPISDDKMTKFRSNMFADQTKVKNKAFLESYNLI